jgi:predicted MPP superfamily phosphohydrolase
LRDLAEAAGAHLVLDEVVEIEVRGQRVAIGGLAVGDKGPWRARAIAELDSRNQSDTLTILLAHRPDVINDMDDDQHVDLIVAGHTHGGQVVLPFLGPLVYYPEIPRSVTVGGLHEIDGRPIYVSTGAGVRSNTAPQVRFGSRPSIGFIDVVPAP